MELAQVRPLVVHFQSFSQTMLDQYLFGLMAQQVKQQSQLVLSLLS
jgi:hypothetical protein